jgi:hypothetical protein
LALVALAAAVVGGVLPARANGPARPVALWSGTALLLLISAIKLWRH